MRRDNALVRRKFARGASPRLAHPEINWAEDFSEIYGNAIGTALERLLGPKQWRRPKKPRRNTLWGALRLLGDCGLLAWLLNDGTLTMRGMRPMGEFATVLAALGAGVRPGTGKRLLALYQEGGWKAVQVGLALSARGLRGRAQVLSLTESFAFERGGFAVMWCTYKQHWFISDDKRRKDCPRHRRAGQMARWYHKKKRIRREREGQRPLRPHVHAYR